MQIIQIMDNFSEGGGVNSFVYDLCLALKEQGADVTLIGILKHGYDTNSIVPKLRAKGICVECLGASSKLQAVLKGIPTLRKLIKEISHGQPTVCNLHLKLSVLMGVLATLGLKNVTCVETYHYGYHSYYLQSLCCRPLIKKYICISEVAHRELVERLGISEKKITVVCNGIPRQKIRDAFLKNKAESDANGKKQLQIVSVGRLEYEKNFKVAILALKQLCCESMRYTLIGSGSQTHEIQQMAAANSYILLPGALPRAKALEILASADIVLIPSLWEGSCLVRLEAMALDKPLILSDVPGLRESFGLQSLRGDELFRFFPGGYLVQTNNPKAYEAALKHYLSIGKHKIKISYIQEISRQYDIHQTAKKYRDVYQKCLNSKTVKERAC